MGMEQEPSQEPHNESQMPVEGSLTPEPVSPPKRKMGAKKRYDTGKLMAMYIRGVSLSEILQLPEYASMSKAYAQKVLCENDCRRRRDSAREFSTGMAGKELLTDGVDDQKKQIKRHFSFMFKAIEKERRIYEERSLTKSIKDQKERLEILERIDERTRKTLGLDDMKATSQDQNSFSLLFSFHSSPDNFAGVITDAITAVTDSGQVKQLPAS